MDPRLAELRADDVLLEMVETHLFARDFDPLAGEKSEEQILHALGRIFAERFVQDPGVIGVKVKRELLVSDIDPTFAPAIPSTTVCKSFRSPALVFQAAYFTPPPLTYFLGADRKCPSSCQRRGQRRPRGRRRRQRGGTMSRVECAWPQYAFLYFIRQAKTLVWLLVYLSLPALARATTVWIDTDISIGSPLREVDDAFALLLAFHSPNLKIAGISTTYGNAPLGATTTAAHALISKLEPRRAIYPGAKSRHDLGRETEASKALAAAVREQQSLTYLALGPLTNLATFQLRHPDLARKIKRVIFIGGTTSATTLRFGTRHSIRVHDANVVKDPAAVAQVLRSRIPITVIPVETAAQLTVTATDLDAMRADAAGNFVQRNSRFWLWFWTKFVGTEGAPIFDAAAIVAVANPNQLAIENRIASIDATGNLIVGPGAGRGGREVLSVVRISNLANTLSSVRRRLRSSAERGPGSDRGPDGSRPNALPASR